MQPIDLTADELVRGLLKLSETEHVSLLDSCGVSHLGSHLLIAGIRPSKVVSIASNAATAVGELDRLASGPEACIFTLSYEVGAELNGVETAKASEPYLGAACFGSLLVHDYGSGDTFAAGDSAAATIAEICSAAADFQEPAPGETVTAASNFTRDSYIAAIEAIQERIRRGETYQTNLTQQIAVDSQSRPQDVFWQLRRDHPAPFAAFITRADSTVVSASPERFFKVERPRPTIYPGRDTSGSECAQRPRVISTSPIKGTRRRGVTPIEDAQLREDLLNSAKDRAENTMIVDLLRNDLGRVCEYGSVRVLELCELEEHPTLFHLVSTVAGELRADATFSDVVRAIFPSGSITGAPKISTMGIIHELESSPRGLSMGAVGYSIPEGFDGLEPVVDLSVAIRTMVFRDGTAAFNVGGGITIDSDPHAEYEESLLKAKALLRALDARL